MGDIANIHSFIIAAHLEFDLSIDDIDLYTDDDVSDPIPYKQRYTSMQIKPKLFKQ